MEGRRKGCNLRQSRLKREQARAKPKRGPKGPQNIEAIKEKVAIEDLVEHLGGAVPRVNNGWTKVSCPFHEDRTPSASLHSVDGRFHCHSCDTSGDVIDLAQKHLKTNEIEEAMAWLAETF